MLIILTFVLACWILCAVFLGLLVASVAGVAYGYNYSMAEFLTFTRSDVTVYMRRGQFNDRPDVRPKGFRRHGEDDAFPDNSGGEDARPDYDKAVDTKPLSDSWVRSQDSRKYAETLTKYNPVFQGKQHREQAVQVDEKQVVPGRRHEESPMVQRLGPEVPNPKLLIQNRNYYKMTTSPDRFGKRISVTPHMLLSTAVWERGSSKIVMRNFHLSTMQDSVTAFDESEEEFRRTVPVENFEDPETLVPSYFRKPTMTSMTDFPKEVTRSTIFNMQDAPMRHWGPNTTPLFDDESEEVDDDDVIYRPG